MTGRDHCIQLLNWLYDVPPPTPRELLERHAMEPAPTGAGQIDPLPGAGVQADATPWVCEDWPHFGDDFLAYEQILKRVERDLFGDTRRIAPVRLLVTDRYDAIVAHSLDMNADQATALGWSVSWYGFLRTCAPDHAPSLPAVGLTGWLAHAPHRPTEVPRDRWQDQVCAWLAQDLARSAWVWSRIVRFMRARGQYLLHGQLVRPSELAQMRQLQSGA